MNMVHDIPATCIDCGAIFRSGMAVGGQGSGIITGNNIVGPCPKCGGNGKVVSGFFQADNDVLKILATSRASAAQIEALIAALRKAQRDGAQASQVEEAIRATAPDLGGLSRFVPKTPADLAAYIQVILALLTLMLMLNQEPPLTQDDLLNALQQTAQTQQSAAPSSPSPERKLIVPEVRRPAPARHQSRNTICACGSGKKHKHCCGRHIDPPAKRLMRT